MKLKDLSWLERSQGLFFRTVAYSTQTFHFTYVFYHRSKVLGPLAQSRFLAVCPGCLVI